MDSHMYHAHGQDRRETQENKTPPPPERKPKQTKTEPKDDGGEGKPEKKTSAWFRRPGG